jgi:hypothetical protein
MTQIKTRLVTPPAKYLETAVPGVLAVTLNSQMTETDTFYALLFDLWVVSDLDPDTLPFFEWLDDRVTFKFVRPITAPDLPVYKDQKLLSESDLTDGLPISVTFDFSVIDGAPKLEPIFITILE